MAVPPVGEPRPTVESFVALAEQIKTTHEQVAATLARLAERGGPDAERRRKLAERSRSFARMEAQHITAFRARQAPQPHP